MIALVNNPSVVTEVVARADTIVLSSEEEESLFGIDFPELIATPLAEADAQVTAPVTTGGDASVYSGAGPGVPGTGPN